MSVPTDTAAPDPFEVRLDATALKSVSVRGSLLIGGSQGLRLVLQIASQVALARLLFPADFGLIAMAYPLVSFAAIFADVGFSETLIQRDRLDQRRVSALFWASLGLSFAMALVVAAASPALAWVYGDHRLMALTALVAMGIPLGSLGGTQGALLMRQMKFGTIVAIEVLTALASTAVTIAAAWAGWSYWSLAFGSLFGQVIAAAANWATCGWRPSRPRMSEHLLDDLKFGGNVTGFNLATFLIQYGDNLIIGTMVGQVALGIYDRSYRLVVQPIGQVLAPVGRVAIPLLSRLKDDATEYSNVFLAIVRAIVALTVPGMLVAAFFGPEVVHILLGPRWVKAGEVFGWMAIAGLVGGVQAAALWLFISQARMRDLRLFTLISSGMNLVSFAIGAIWGILGVAISFSIVHIITTPLIFYGATREGPVTPWALTRTCLPFAAAAGVSVALVAAFRSAVAFPPVAEIGCGLVIAYAVFAAVGLGPRREREKLFAMVRLLRQSK